MILTGSRNIRHLSRTLCFSKYVNLRPGLNVDLSRHRTKLHFNSPFPNYVSVPANNNLKSRLRAKFSYIILLYKPVSQPCMRRAYKSLFWRAIRPENTADCMNEWKYFLKYNINISIIIRFKQYLPSSIQSVEFTRRVARQNNGLYVLRMTVKLAYFLARNLDFRLLFARTEA